MVRNDAVVGFGEAEGNPAPFCLFFYPKNPAEYFFNATLIQNPHPYL